MVAKYQKKISGPMLDRFDILIAVPRVEYEKLADDRLGEPSRPIRAPVEAAETAGALRAPATRGVQFGHGGGGDQVHKCCKPDGIGRNLMKAAMQQMNLPARAYPGR